MHNKAKHCDVFFVPPAAPQKIRACWRRFAVTAVFIHITNADQIRPSMVLMWPA